MFIRGHVQFGHSNLLSLRWSDLIPNIPQHYLQTFCNPGSDNANVFCFTLCFLCETFVGSWTKHHKLQSEIKSSCLDWLQHLTTVSNHLHLPQRQFGRIKTTAYRLPETSHGWIVSCSRSSWIWSLCWSERCVFRMIICFQTGSGCQKLCHSSLKKWSWLSLIWNNDVCQAGWGVLPVWRFADSGSK